MWAWLENLKMPRKLLVLLFLPCLALLVFAISSIIEDYKEIKIRTNEAKLGNIILFADQLMDTVDLSHHASIDYLNNRNDQFSKFIAEYRQTIDQKISQLQEATSDPELLSYYPQLTAIMKPLFDRVNELPRIRREIDSHAIKANEVTSFYTALDAETLASINQTIGFINHLDIAKFLYSYSNIVEEQRAAEIEKEVINHALIDQKLSLENYNKILKSALTQENYQNTLRYFLPKEAKQIYQSIVTGPALNDATQIRNQVLESLLEGNVDISPQIWEQAQNAKINLLQTAQIALFEQMQKRAEEISWSKQKQLLLQLLLTSIVFCITGILGWAVASVITKPLNKASQLARKVSEGFLFDPEPPSSREDEIGVFDRALHRMVENLKSLTKQIQQQATTLSTSAEEIMSSVTELTTNTSETAAAVSETTSTVEELRQTGQLSSEKAKDVQESAEGALVILNESEKSLKNTITDMQQIDDRMKTISDSIIKLSELSQAIRKIIDTVNELAEQSNLLAVNAAIEAAKAGEHGKGFNVVALEVRRLAEQSKTATIQIRAILNDIQNATNSAVLASEQGANAVSKGVRQSIETNSQLKSLSEGMNRFTSSASQIALSSQQQLVGVGQVTIAMTNIKDASNHHLNSMRQIETAVQEINTIGIQLKKLIDQFKL